MTVSIFLYVYSPLQTQSLYTYRDICLFYYCLFTYFALTQNIFIFIISIRILIISSFFRHKLLFPVHSYINVYSSYHHHFFLSSYNFQNGNHRAKAWLEAWDNISEARKIMLAHTAKCEDHLPLLFAIVLDRSKLTREALNVIRVNNPVVQAMEDDLDSALTKVSENASVLEMRKNSSWAGAPKFSTDIITSVVTSLGYKANHSHCKTLLRCKFENRNAWKTLNDVIFKTSQHSLEEQDRARLNGTAAVFVNDIFPPGFASTKIPLAQQKRWTEAVLGWIEDDLPTLNLDEESKSHLYKIFRHTMNAMRSIKRELEKNELITRLSDEEITRYCRLKLNPIEKKTTLKKKSAEAAEFRSGVQFSLPSFGGNTLSRQISLAIGSLVEHKTPVIEKIGRFEGTSGAVVTGDFFHKKSLMQLRKVIEEHFVNKKNEVLLFADIPYFLTDAPWDKYETACALLPPKDPKKKVNRDIVLCRELCNRIFDLMSHVDGSAFIFCSDAQALYISKCFETDYSVQQSLKREKNIVESSNNFSGLRSHVKRYVVRKSKLPFFYSSLMYFLDYQPQSSLGFRFELQPNSESYVQIIFGTPQIEYHGIFHSRAAELSCEWTAPSEYIKNRAGQSLNSTQKPVKFFVDYIKSFKNAALVLDLFAGTGSASVAALECKVYVLYCIILCISI